MGCERMIDHYNEFKEAGVMPGNLERKHESVFDTVKILMRDERLTYEEAIKEVERKLRVPLPMDIKDRIRGEIK